jgi:Animal haem peroxidase
MASSFNINKEDLAFILKQIKIAENTSIGYTPAVGPVSIKQAIMDAYGFSAADAAIAPYGLRTVDGTYNNLLSESTKTLGAADTLFPRLTTPVYLNEQDEAAFFGVTNTNYGVAGSVVDSDPRTISNLIVDMSVNNPAAIAAFLNNPLSVAYYMDTHGGIAPTAANLTNADLSVLPNQSPDIGLSPGFNSWMTFFGQFFDHGLDLVTKGNNGTIYIPLMPDDPLIAGADGIINTADDLAPNLRFMALTRATPTFVNGVAQHQNTTTAFVDQNQTYTSHSAHQVFLREYNMVAGGAVSTGKLLDGAVAGTIATWGDVKAQSAAKLGIKLSDFDVHDVPLLATDQYGKFIPAANGFAQVTVQVQILNSSGVVIGTMGTPFLMCCRWP